MTDIEKKTYKVTLIRGAAICISLIACTWKLSGSFSEASNEFYGLKRAIDAMAINMNELTRRDSMNKVEIAQLQSTNSHQEHDLDSVKKVLKMLAKKAHMKGGMTYYTERRVNGRIVTEVLD